MRVDWGLMDVNGTKNSPFKYYLIKLSNLLASRGPAFDQR